MARQEAQPTRDVVSGIEPRRHEWEAKARTILPTLHLGQQILQQFYPYKELLIMRLSSKIIILELKRHYMSPWFPQLQTRALRGE